MYHANGIFMMIVKGYEYECFLASYYASIHYSIMSLKTRINGFTAWVNLRLVPYDSLLTNVLTDLTKGVHVQQLLHSKLMYQCYCVVYMAE